MSSVHEAAATPPDPPSPEDLETADLLKEHDATRLTGIRTGADKWAAGLTAITGLVSTALFIKGPEEILKIPEASRPLVGWLVLGALLALIIGTLLIYSAAHGPPLALRKVDRTLPGLGARYELARMRAEKSAMKFVTGAVVFTVAGVLTLFAAAMVTWIAGTAAAKSEQGACFEVDGMTIKLQDIQSVEERQVLTVVPCPETASPSDEP